MEKFWLYASLVIFSHYDPFCVKSHKTNDVGADCESSRIVWTLCSFLCFGCDTICGSGAWGLAKGSLDADGGEEGSIEVDAEVFDGPFVETDAGEAAVVTGDGEVDKHVLRCGKLLNLIPMERSQLM